MGMGGELGRLWGRGLNAFKWARAAAVRHRVRLAGAGELGAHLNAFKK